MEWLAEPWRRGRTLADYGPRRVKLMCGSVRICRLARKVRRPLRCESPTPAKSKVLECAQARQAAWLAAQAFCHQK